ncbi:MAG: FAD-dependent oxidoreductase [Chlorobia bacterium]|nr:FAD-dependent oxidoreductase [Fimbriimonadaceae bacterium]
MSKSIIVIGGGAIGLCCAYYLVRAGHRVTVLERGGPHHDCCSLGNAGMVVPSHFEPLAAPGMVGYGMRMMLRKNGPFGFKPSLNADLVRWGWLFARSSTAANVERGSRLLRDLNMASRTLYQEMAEASDDAFGLEECGLVMLCATQKGFDAESKLADHARSLDLKVRVLDRGEVEDLEPTTRLKAAGAVHFLDDCHLNPVALVHWLQEETKRLGVEHVFSSAVTGAKVENGKVKALQTSTGDVAADEYVLAAGAWSGQLAKRLGFRMPMQGGKGYSSDLPVSVPPKHCFILVEARIAVTPIGDRLRFAGTMEIVGDDLSVNLRKHQGILNSIPSYMPDFAPEDFSELGVWSGLRPCSADGLPYLGRPSHLSNLIVATGHSMMGVSMAPVSGKLVANLVGEEKLEFEIGVLKPDRFS